MLAELAAQHDELSQGVSQVESVHVLYLEGGAGFLRAREKSLFWEGPFAVRSGIEDFGLRSFWGIGKAGSSTFGSAV